MSPFESLQHSPLEVMMISESEKKRKRRFLREEIAIQEKKRILEGTIVRIKKNQNKDFASVKKESYQYLSPYYIVLSIDKSREVWTYIVGNIFTFQPLEGQFSRNELVVMPIDLLAACEKEERNVKSVVKKDFQYCWYKVDYLDMTFCANISLLQETAH